MHIKSCNLISSTPFDIPLQRDELLKILAQRFVKKGRDRFMWWRSYKPKNRELSNRATLYDRINNGQFDISSYPYEIQLAQHKINDLWSEYHNDPGRYAELTSIHRRRISKLREDFQKDEQGKIDLLKKEMLIEFKITQDQYEEELMNFEQESVLEFYKHIESRYSSYISLRVNNIPNYLS